MRQLIGALPIPTDERILSGFQNAEDAAVFRLDSERAVVFTVDIITPLVDDAKTYGAIAAANALSDIHAMGAEGLMSLSFLGVPKGFPVDVTVDIVRGGAELALAENTPVLGGHSVESKDVMFGLAVIGMVHPERLFRNDGLKPGDQLILTKPLGTGTLTTALKRDKLPADQLQPAVDGMLRTNAGAVATLRDAGVRAATDITGFGLLGHAAEMASGSGVQVVIEQRLVPAYPRAREMIDGGVQTRGNVRNPEYVMSLGPLEGDPEPLLYDPQTSGGLLAAVPAAKVDSVVERLAAAGYDAVARIGEARDGAGLKIS